jgi:hypothetical protein
VRLSGCLICGQSKPGTVINHERNTAWSRYLPRSPRRNEKCPSAECGTPMTRTHKSRVTTRYSWCSTTVNQTSPAIVVVGPIRKRQPHKSDGSIVYVRESKRRNRPLKSVSYAKSKLIQRLRWSGINNLYFDLLHFELIHTDRRAVRVMVIPICRRRVDFFLTRHYSVPSFAGNRLDILWQRSYEHGLRWGSGCRTERKRIHEEDSRPLCG